MSFLLWEKRCIMKKILIILLSFCSFFTFTATDIQAYSISYGDLKKIDAKEQVIGYTPIGHWNNGSFFETVTWQKIGRDINTGRETYRFRHYITHKGEKGSYIYQKVPVGLYLNGNKIVTFDQTNGGRVRNTTKLWGEYTLALAPGIHKVELRDIKSGAITVVNVEALINVPVPQYTVTYVDYNGTILKQQRVDLNKNATAPSNPSREGYIFTGWDNDGENIISDRIITAQYNMNEYTVNFLDYDNQLIDSKIVHHGGSAIPPPDPSREGYTFTGWDGIYTNVTSNRSIKALYKIKSYMVHFDSNGGTQIPSQIVTHGDTAQKPTDPLKDANTFIGWYNRDHKLFDFRTPIIKETTLLAKWDGLPTISAEDITIFEDLYSEEEWKKIRMDNATASDPEDGNMSEAITVKKDNVDVRKKGVYEVIYEVCDRGNHRVEKKIKVTVLDKRAEEDSTKRYIRSISKDYKNTLHEYSKWLINDDLYAKLEDVWKESSSNTETWKLTAKDIAAIRDFNHTHGYSKKDNALFMKQFEHLKISNSAR